MNKEYLSIDLDSYNIIDGVKKKNLSTEFHYFGQVNELSDAKAIIKELVIIEKYEEYLTLDPDNNVRLDRIIALNGKPGSAYDEYDSYGPACLDCMGGME